MRKIIFVILIILIGMCPAMGTVLEYEFAGTIDKAVRGSYEIDADSFSGGFTWDSSYYPFSYGDGVANYVFDDFHVTISGSSHEWNYPSAMLTRRQVQVRNRATENSDSICFLADNWGSPYYWVTVQYRIELKDYDKTVFTDDALPQSLDLSNFEVRSFRGNDYSLQFEGTITSLTFIPEPATFLLLGLGGLLLRKRK